MAVVQSYVSALDQLRTDYASQGQTARFHLVGFSGGGGISVLVAAHRADIASVRSVAGLLDTDGFSHYHRVSAMTGSVNPVAVVGDLRPPLVQRHYGGGDDPIMPAPTQQGFVTRLPSATRCGDWQQVAGASHEKGWTDVWPSLNTQFWQECL
jgi:dienelactone hydrolase